MALENADMGEKDKFDLMGDCLDHSIAELRNLKVWDDNEIAQSMMGRALGMLVKATDIDFALEILVDMQSGLTQQKAGVPLTEVMKNLETKEQNKGN